MPSVIAVDGTVRSLNGTVVNDEGGAPCCCGGCDFVYLAELCNERCVEEYKYRHICGDLQCPNVPGGHVGPIVPGIVIREGSRCYKIIDPTKYCPPGLTCTRPRYPKLPVRTTPLVVSGLGCLPTCATPLCPPLNGWYPTVPCPCSAPPTVPVYVRCDILEAANQAVECPTWNRASACVHVPDGAVPILNPPPEAVLVTSPPDFANCCYCCSGQVSCNSCTLPSVLSRCGLGCTLEVTQEPYCSLCNPATVYHEFSASQLVEQWNFQFGVWCPVSLDCYRRISSSTIRGYSYSFSGDCSPGPISTGANCGGAFCNHSLLANDITITDYGAPVSCISDLSGGLLPDWTCSCSPGPNCCPVCQDLRTCDQWQHSNQVNPQWNPNTCNGQRITRCAVGRRFSSGGGCNAPPCNGGLFRVPGLVYSDGTLVGASPSERIIIPNVGGSGCSGCGGDKGELV